MNSLVWEIAWVGLERALTSHCVCVCMWTDIINTGVNDIFSVITLTAGLNLCLEIIGLSKTISCFMNTDKYTPQLSWGSTSSLSLTLYIVSFYSWNTEVNSTFIRQTLLLHLFHPYQVTFIKTGTLPEADLQCTVCLLVLIKTRIGFEKC